MVSLKLLSIVKLYLKLKKEFGLKLKLPNISEEVFPRPLLTGRSSFF